MSIFLNMRDVNKMLCFSVCFSVFLCLLVFQLDGLKGNIPPMSCLQYLFTSYNIFPIPFRFQSNLPSDWSHIPAVTQCCHVSLLQVALR